MLLFGTSPARNGLKTATFGTGPEEDLISQLMSKYHADTWDVFTADEVVRNTRQKETGMKVACEGQRRKGHRNSWQNADQLEKPSSSRENLYSWHLVAHLNLAGRGRSESCQNKGTSLSHFSLSDFVYACMS